MGHPHRTSDPATGFCREVTKGREGASLETEEPAGMWVWRSQAFDVCVCVFAGVGSGLAGERA